MIDERTVAETALSFVPGSKLEDLVRSPTRVTCFLFAVAWWAPHRVHYDLELAREEGYDDVMVPGLLLNEYVVSAVTSWTGDPTTLRRMTIRNAAPVFAGETVTVRSEVVAVEEVPATGAGPGERSVAIAFDYRITKGEGLAVAGGRAVVEVPLPRSA